MSSIQKHEKVETEYYGLRPWSTLNIKEKTKRTLAVAVSIGSIATLFGGVVTLEDKTEREAFPELNENKPAEIYREEFYKKSGSIKKLPGMPINTLSLGGNSGHYLFGIRQKVRNQDGDVAYAQEPVVATPEEAKSYEIGDTVTPAELNDIDRIKARPTEHVRLPLKDAN